MRNLNTRIACIFLPAFPLAAILRSRQELVGVPVAIIHGKGSHATVAFASIEARAGGVTIGIGASRAKQRLVELKALQPSEDAQRSAQAALIEVAFAFSPRVEEAGSGEVYLDLGDMNERYESEGVVATGIDIALRRIHLPCRVGIGSGKTVARIAAQASTGVSVVPRGHERDFLAPLPVDILNPPKLVLARLSAWGIRTLGEFSALSPNSVARRLGSEGARLQSLAWGKDEVPFYPTIPERVYEEAISFDDWLIYNLEPLLCVTGELVDRLMVRLFRHGLAARGLIVALKLDPSGNDIRHQEFAAPLTDAKAVMELLRLDLNKRPPTAAIAGIRAVALPGTPSAVQHHLFEPPDPSPAKWAVTLARIQALVGEANVGIPVCPQRRNTTAIAHTAAAVRTLRRPHEEKSKSRPRKTRPVFAMAVMRPPLPIHVDCGGGRPVAVHIDERRFSVRRIAGPWELYEAWWTIEPVDLESFDLELVDGRLITVALDKVTNTWLWTGTHG